MAEFEPYYPLYAGAFLKGLRDLNVEQIGAYTLIVMTCYEARGPIREEYSMLGNRCGSNQRPFQRIVPELVELGRIKRLEKDGQTYLIDDRTARELERAEARIAKKRKKSLTDFNGKNQSVSQNPSKKPNNYVAQKGFIEIIEKIQQVPEFDAPEKCEKSASFGTELELSRETCSKIPLETVPLKETKNKKKRAHARAPARTRDSADAIALEALSSACSLGESDPAFSYFVDNITDIIGRTIIVNADRVAAYADKKYGSHLSAHRFEVVAINSREAVKAYARRESAGGSGADVSKAGAQERQPSPLSSTPDLADHQNGDLNIA
jgi:uncharacterized protein YdaU (DUF1376 family)